MLSDKVLEIILKNPKMWKIPQGTQALAIDAFNDAIEEIVEENPYATVSELLSGTTNANVSADTD